MNSTGKLLISVQIVLLLAVLKNVLAQNQLPNVEAVGSGYDYLYGNPHSYGSDPGMREPVYDLFLTNNKQNRKTADGLYSIPDNIMVRQCQSCSLKFTTDIITGPKAFQEVLKAHVKTNYAANDPAFSAAEDFARLYAQTTVQNRVVTESKAICQLYCVQMETYAVPQLSEDFKNAVDSLTLSDNTTFTTFISAFGTHVITKIAEGSLVGLRSYFDSGKFAKLSLANKDLETLFNAAAYIAATGVTYQYPESSQSSYVAARSYSQNVFSTGNLPTNSSITDGSNYYSYTTYKTKLEQSWLTQTQLNPNPISYTIVPLDTILTNKNFPNDSAIADKRKQLKSVMSGYCNQLLAQGLVVSCGNLPKDPPLPKKPVFGGGYAVSDNDTYNLYYSNYNPSTNDYSCPTGYTAYEAYHFTDCFNGASTVFVCLSSESDPEKVFGGFVETYNGSNPTGVSLDGNVKVQNCLPSRTASNCSSIPYEGVTTMEKIKLGQFNTFVNSKYYKNNTAMQYMWLDVANYDEGAIGGGYIYYYDTKLRRSSYSVNPVTKRSGSCPSGYSSYRFASGMMQSPVSSEVGCGYAYICWDMVSNYF